MSESGATTQRDEAVGDQGVAEVLERLRAGVRQRQGELACLDSQRGDLPASLAAVRRDAVLEEPGFKTEGISAVRAFVERAVYVLFARRQHRALLRQQNRFNRSVELALVDLHARQEALDDQLRRATAGLEGPTEAAAAERVVPLPVTTAPRVVGRGTGSA